MNQPDANPYASPRDGTSDASQPITLGGPIVLRGEVGLDVHLRAHRLAWSGFRIGWRFPVVIGIVVLLAAAPVMLEEDGWSIWLWLSFIITVPALVLVYFALLRQSGIWWIRRAFARGDLKQEPAIWTITDDGIHVVTDTIDSKEKWANYESWRASDDLILLYGRGQTIYIPLAREFCASDADWRRLREFLQEKLPEKKA